VEIDDAMKKSLVFVLPVFALFLILSQLAHADVFLLNCKTIATTYRDDSVGSEAVYTIDTDKGTVSNVSPNNRLYTLTGNKRNMGGSKWVFKVEVMSNDKIELSTTIDNDEQDRTIINRHNGVLTQTSNSASLTATCRKAESQGF